MDLEHQRVIIENGILSFPRRHSVAGQVSTIRRVPLKGDFSRPHLSKCINTVVTIRSIKSHGPQVDPRRPMPPEISIGLRPVCSRKFGATFFSSTVPLPAQITCLASHPRHRLPEYGGFPRRHSPHSSVRRSPSSRARSLLKPASPKSTHSAPCPMHTRPEA